MKFNVLKIYYEVSNDEKRIFEVLNHSMLVYNKALEIVKKNFDLKVDLNILKYGALFHDIGVLMLGDNDNYLIHGYLGGNFFRNKGYEKIARIAERHIGIGLKKEEIEMLKLPIPKKDYVPETIEEEIVMIADKFYSKSSGDRELTVFEICKKFEKLGSEKVSKFLDYCKKYNLI